MSAPIASGPHSRRGAVDTSAQAAAAIAPRLGALQVEVLRVFGYGAWSADEVAQALGKSVLTIRPRVTELARARLLYDTGLRTKNASGQTAAVWRATRRAHDLLAGLA